MDTLLIKKLLSSQFIFLLAMQFFKYTYCPNFAFECLVNIKSVDIPINRPLRFLLPGRTSI